MTEHDWRGYFERAHQIDIVAVAQRMTKLRKEGRDWAGACPRPNCAKEDGFVVTPSTGLFVCRPSGEGGDAVQMVQHAKGCSVHDALEFVLGETIDGREESPEAKEARERKWAEAKAAADKRAAEHAKADERKQATTESRIAELVERAVPVYGTHGWRYLVEGRRVDPQERLCRDLLFVPDADYWGYPAPGAPKIEKLATLPAIIARVRDADGADGFSIHQTFLDPVEPRKWRAPDPDRNGVKKFRGSPRGGLVRLGRTSRALAIGEGIETVLGWYALAFGGDDVSLAAVCGLERLPSIPLPPVVEEVILIGDGDGEHPEKTAALLIKAGEAFTAQGRRVFVHVSPRGQDWADVAKALSRN